MSRIVNFTGCSHYSEVGASSPASLVKKIVQNGDKFAALTEYANINSAIEFYTEAKEKGIIPILGIQIPVEDKWNRKVYKKLGKRLKEDVQTGLLTVHLKTEAAYKRMCQLTYTMAQRALNKDNHEPKGYLTLAEVASIPDITVGSSRTDGLVGRSFVAGQLDTAETIYKELTETFKDFYVEISPHSGKMFWFKPMFGKGGTVLVRNGQFAPNPHTTYAPDGDMQKGLNDFMLKLTSRYGGTPVPSLDYHYADVEHKIAQNAKLNKDGIAFLQVETDRQLRPLSESKQLFVTMGYPELAVDEWFGNLDDWANKFTEFKMLTNKDRWILPEFKENTLEWTKAQIDRVGRMDWNDPELVSKVKHEIQTLARNGKIDVIPYFAPIVDVCKWCDQEGILYNLRGSASGSLLVYLMGISGFNPLKFGLSFERFINEGRIKGGNLPDTDIDIGERDRVVEYLEGKYGNKVMQLSVDIMTKLKTAIRDAERSLKGEVTKATESFCSSLPDPPTGSSVTTYNYVFGYIDEDGTKQEGLLATNESLQEFAASNPETWKITVELLGVLRNKGRHACSFVITDKPVYDYVPVHVVGGDIVTGFSPKSLEKAGLVKYDFLGVNTLNDIGAAIKLIQKQTGQKINIYDLPDDAAVYEEFARGRCETVFQYNTVTVSPFLKSIRPKNLKELGNVTALARPGTLDAPADDGVGTLADVYVKRVNGDTVKYIHNDVKPILSESYGVALYQEQVMRFFTDLGGYTAQEADDVRRGIGKKDEKTLREAGNRLKKACVNRGWSQDQADMLFKQIMASSKYSFNKSHSISYAHVGYACQYLKTKYPLEWWASVLGNASKTELPKFWDHCKHLALLPDINKSGEGWQVEGKKIRAPINILNGVGEIAYKAITETKPYASLKNFVQKAKAAESSRSLHKGVIMKLIASGTMDSFFPPNSTLEYKLQEYLMEKAEAEGKVKIEEIPEEYRTLDEVELYKIVKELIPVISQDLRPLVLPRLGAEYLDNPPSIWKFRNKYYVSGQARHNCLDLMLSNKESVDLLNRQIKTISYVIDEKTKMYSNKTKQMTQLLIDSGGIFDEAVVWPQGNSSAALTGFKNKIVEITWQINTRRRELSIYEIKEMNIPKQL